MNIVTSTAPAPAHAHVAARSSPFAPSFCRGSVAPISLAVSSRPNLVTPSSLDYYAKGGRGLGKGKGKGKGKGPEVAKGGRTSWATPTINPTTGKVGNLTWVAPHLQSVRSLTTLVSRCNMG